MTIKKKNGHDDPAEFNAQQALIESEEKYRKAFNTSPDAVNVNRLEDGLCVDINEGFTKLTGFTRDEVIGRSSLEINLWHDPADRHKLVQGLREKGYFENLEAQFRKKDGSLGTGLMSASIISINSTPHIISITRDITGRKQAEEALRVSESKLKSIFIAAPVGIGLVKNRVLIEANDTLCSMTGYSREELLGQNARILYPTDEEYEYVGQEKYRQISQNGTGTVETLWRRKNGEVIHIILSSTPLDLSDLSKGVTFTALDITGRKRMEEEKAKMEEHYRQAQKIEAIGQLAGGIAHDFNNMLNIILGYSQMALMKIDPSSPVHADIREIVSAGKRSTDLVRQLLAFARKQTIAPKVLDLNYTVSGMLNMLRKLIGEDIDLLWMPAAELWPVKMDPAQVDQILANLAVNARDAIAGVGKMTIETGRAEFDEAYWARHIGFIPGQYVVLAVSDNGCGMDDETLEKIYDPFFTTKEIGKGTGMGLSRFTVL